MIRSQGKILTGKMNNQGITETGLRNGAAFGLPFQVGMHPENQLMVDSTGAGKETEHMARKSRYMGYAKELQKLSKRTEKNVKRTAMTAKISEQASARMSVERSSVASIKTSTKISEETTSKLTAQTSSRESVLHKLKSLKGKEFHMTIPVAESTDA